MHSFIQKIFHECLKCYSDLTDVLYIEDIKEKSLPLSALYFSYIEKGYFFVKYKIFIFFVLFCVNLFLWDSV